jgi:hypothetical protein
VTERELVAAAIRKAGNQKALARLFGVSQSAISEWGRARPIPRHVKPRLESYLEPEGRRTADTEETAPSRREFESILSRLTQHLEVTIRRLPRSYQQRYQGRLKELLSRVERDLLEYSRLLEAEFHSQAKRRTERK